MRISLPALALCATFLCGCQTMFLASHDEFDILPEEQEIALGAKAYQEILDTEPKSQNAHLSQMVERVGQRIAAVSERPDYQWEFVLLARPTQNAFCLPGGKVAVYEGILPICQNEAGLAVVISHEIAHSLARHGAERMSNQISSRSSEWTLAKVLGHREAEHVEMVKSVYGADTGNRVALPFSRTQESEADSIGLTLMARAGYDPQEAPRFWQRFQPGVASKVPVLLSTHPSDEKRVTKLNELIPRAQLVYQSAPQRYGLAEQIPMTALKELAVVPETREKPAEPAKPVEAAATTAVAEAPATASSPATPAPQVPTKPTIETTGVSVTVAPVVKVEPAVSNPISTLGAPTVDASVAPANPIVQAVAEQPAPEVPAKTEVPPASPPTTPPAGVPASVTPETPSEYAPLVVPDDWTPHVE
jgi:hypothetical protein